MKPLRLLATTVIAWVIALVAVGAPLPPAQLVVYAEQGQPFGLVLDGRALTWPVARQVRTSLLLPGWHLAEVSVPAPFGPPQRLCTRIWLEPGRETDYLLVVRRAGPQLRQLPVAGGAAYGPALPPGGQPGPAYPGGGYYGNGSYSAPAYPNSNSPAPYPGPATPQSYPNSEYPSDSSYPGAGAYPGPNSGYPGGQPQPAPGTYPAPGASYPAPVTPATPGSYYPEAGSYLRPLSDPEVTEVQRAMGQRSFDEERLSIAKQALGARTVRATQLAALLRTLSFDQSRVQLATFGYAHVADQSNFYQVYDALQFDASVREVRQALNLP